jgi:hypothetical protein
MRRCRGSSGLQQLEELGTDGVQVSDAGLAQFTALTKLRSLSFFHPSFGMKGFNGSGYAALRELPQLERLTIAGTPFDDRGMAAVAEIKQLRDFRTWHTYQTQAGNQALTQAAGTEIAVAGTTAAALRRRLERGQPR